MGRRGRKKLPARRRRSVTLSFRVTPEEARLIRRVAEACDQLVTEFIRETVTEGAQWLEEQEDDDG